MTMRRENCPICRTGKETPACQCDPRASRFDTVSENLLLGLATGLTSTPRADAWPVPENLLSHELIDRVLEDLPMEGR